MKPVNMLTKGITAIAVLALYSCLEDGFDLNNQDQTIAIGGDSLVIPLGSTTKLSLGDFTSKSGGYLVKDDDSSFCIEFKQKFDAKGDFPEFTVDQRTMDAGDPVEVPVACQLPPVPVPVGNTYHEDSVNFVVEKEAVLEITLDDQVTTYISSLDSIIFENGASIQCSVNMSKLPDVNSDPLLDLCIEFPERYIFNDSRIIDNKLILKGQKIVRNKPFILTPALGIRGILFDGESIVEHLVVTDTIGVNVKIQYLDVEIGYEAASNLSINGNVTVDVANTVLKEMYGIIRYSTETPQYTTIEIEDIPQEICNQDNILDASPVINFVYTSNISAPISSDMWITPYWENEPMLDRKVDFTVNFPAADRGLDSTTTIVHVGSTPSDNAQININKDLSPLLRTIPSAFDIEYTMSTVQEGQHYLDLSKQVIANMDCNVKVPLKFGQDLLISYKDTMEISDMDSNIMTMLQDNELHLIADFATTMPLDIALNLTFLDQNGNPADKIQIPQQTIKAGARDNEHVSHFDIAFSDPDKSVESLSGIIYNLTVTAPTENAGLFTDTYLQAKMRLFVPGGININIDEL